MDSGDRSLPLSLGPTKTKDQTLWHGDLGQWHCDSAFIFLFLLLCVGALSARMSEHHMCVAQSPRRSEEGIDPPERVMDGCQITCRCWELNMGPLEGQPVLLTVAPSLQLN